MMGAGEALAIGLVCIAWASSATLVQRNYRIGLLILGILSVLVGLVRLVPVLVAMVAQ